MSLVFESVPASCSRVAERAKWLALAACALVACSETHDMPLNPASSPLAGLYTPGSQIGVVKVEKDAGTSDAGMIPSGDRCVGAPGDGMTGVEGTLTIQFMTKELFSQMPYAPKNVGAVWIEDANGTYIKTTELWAAERVMSLFWLDHICMGQKPFPEVDVMTQATLLNNDKMHSSTWGSYDFRRKRVPDGNYVLNIEVTSREYKGVIEQFPFVKGTDKFTMQLAESPNHTLSNITLTYTPNVSDTAGQGGASGSGDTGGAGAGGIGGTGASGRSGGGASGIGGIGASGVGGKATAGAGGASGSMSTGFGFFPGAGMP